jgi:5-formyltetrahydrofolate cyclo-ligase
MSYVAQKKALRRQSLAARDALDPNTRCEHSLRICSIAACLPHLSGARCVALYAPIGSEVDVEPLLLQLLALRLVVALPRMRPDKRLDFVAVTSLAHPAAGGFGIREPEGAALPITQLDLVMVPGLAFDGEGHRLGYGGGYYDRTLLGYTQAVIGIAFSQQIHASVPAAPHDRFVDGVVCELGYKPRLRPHNSGQTSGPVAT